jgi:hypothetical protein
MPASASIRPSPVWAQAHTFAFRSKEAARVKVFNFDGMAFFGPGSEWFWTMAQFLLLTVTGLAIYRQLRTQGSANALTAQSGLRTEWESPTMVRLRVASLIHIASGKPGQPPGFRLVGNFFAGLASLVTHGHVRSTDSWELWSGQTQFWWALAAPWLSAIRSPNPGIWGEFEELSATMAALDHKNGVPNFIPGDLSARVEREGKMLIERLRLEQEAKEGVVPRWPHERPISAVPVSQ